MRAGIWHRPERVPPSPSAEDGTILERTATVHPRSLADRGAAGAGDGCGPSNFSIAVARAAGAARVFATDVNDFKLDMATKVGADHVFRVDRPGAGHPHGHRRRGVDAVLEIRRPDGINMGLRLLRGG